MNENHAQVCTSPEWARHIQTYILPVLTRDVDLGEREIGAGQPVVSLLGAANRDPQVFRDPDRIDFGRPVQIVNPLTGAAAQASQRVGLIPSAADLAGQVPGLPVIRHRLV